MDSNTAGCRGATHKYIVGVVGIYIHGLEDYWGRQASKGHNPFDDFYIDRQINYISHRSTPLDDNDVLMSAVCKAYDPPYVTSKVVYQDIKDNIEKLIEEAIEIRNRYPK